MATALLRRSAGGLQPRYLCALRCCQQRFSHSDASSGKEARAGSIAESTSMPSTSSEWLRVPAPEVLGACGAMAGAVALSNYLVQFPVGWIGTWGTAVFPLCFLITDVTNRFHGAAAARQVVYTGFAVGVPISFFLLPDEPRIAAASGAAFLISQLLDVRIFDALRGHRIWWIPPLCSSVAGGALDSVLFGTIAFFGVDMPTERWPLVGEVPHWVTWGVGDFVVKSSFAVLNLLPFRFVGARRLAQGAAQKPVRGSAQ